MMCWAVWPATTPSHGCVGRGLGCCTHVVSGDTQHAFCGLRLQLVTVGALRAVTERLRDVRRSVRREAATRLAAVFRHDGPQLSVLPVTARRACCSVQVSLLAMWREGRGSPCMRSGGCQAR